MNDTQTLRMASNLRPRRARSRNGCLCCRRRRKKCDEQKPRCIACQRNKLSCTWPDEPDIKPEPADTIPHLHHLPEIDQQDHHIQTFLDIFRAACSQPRPRRHPELSFQISKNLHHYFDHTAQTLEALTPPPFRALWTTLVLEGAKTFPFVMNALDAIAALHRAHLAPEDAAHNIETACHSRAASINDFRCIVRTVRPQNASGTLVFAAIQVLLCLGFPIALDDSNAPNILDGAHELLIAIRGLFHLHPVAYPYITDPVLREWMQGPGSTLSEVPQNPEALQHVSYLYGLLQKLSLEIGESEKETYHAALAQLWQFFVDVPLRPREWNVLFAWPVSLPDAFLVLVQRRRPFALVILVSWFWFVFRGSRHWLLHAWAGRVFAGVEGAVGSEWRGVLKRLEYDWAYDAGIGGVTRLGMFCIV